MITNKQIEEMVGHSKCDDMPYADRESRFLKVKNKYRNSIKAPIDVFSENGYLMLGDVLNDEQCESIKKFLMTKTVYNGHVPAYANMKCDSFSSFESLPSIMPSVAPNDLNYYSWSLGDLLENKDITRLCSNPLLINFAQQYLGGIPPSLFTVNAMLNVAGGVDDGLVRTMHRDFDDLRTCSLLVYLTDVNEDSGGSFLIKEGTHLGVDEGKEVRVYGKKGTGWLVDGYGWHRGTRVNKGHRILLWIRYSIYDNPTYKDVDKNWLLRADYDTVNEHVDLDNAINKNVFRLVVKDIDNLDYMNGVSNE
jgi:hypothetical protein